MVVRPPLAASVVGVVLVVGNPDPEETTALGEGPPLRPGVEMGAVSLVAGESPAPDRVPVMVKGMPLPSNDV